jgi:hypothetical protein
MENNNNTEEPQSIFYVATLLIDVEQLRNTRAEDIGDAEEDLDEAIAQEMGWVRSSGISLYECEKVEPIDDKVPYLVEVTCAYDGFEFSEKSVLLVDKGADVGEAAEALARGFEVDEEHELIEETRIYCFKSGKEVWVSEVKEISEVEYHILKKHL